MRKLRPWKVLCLLIKTQGDRDVELDLEPGLFLAPTPTMVKGRGETTGFPQGEARAHTESYEVQSDGWAAPSDPGTWNLSPFLGAIKKTFPGVRPEHPVWNPLNWACYKEERGLLTSSDLISLYLTWISKGPEKNSAPDTSKSWVSPDLCFFPTCASMPLCTYK